jgi:hypothetical protein
MMIPSIESRASKISRDKGNEIWDCLTPSHFGSTDKDLRLMCGNNYGHLGPAIDY